MIRLLVVLSIALIPCWAYSQDTLVSRQEYREAVLAYSLDLKLAAQYESQLKAQRQAVRTGHLPKLSLSGSFTASARNFTNRKHWTFDLQPQLIQTLWGKGIGIQVQNADLEIEIAQLNEKSSRLEILYAADFAYWNLSAMGLYVHSMKHYVAIIESLKQIVEQRFEEGYIAKSDVLMIQTRLQEARYELINAQENYAIARHHFNSLRGCQLDHKIALREQITASQALPRRVLWQNLLALRPDYRATTLKTRQALLHEKMVKSSYKPQLEIGVGGIWRPYLPNQNGDTYLDGSAFVRLSVPLFHWNERRAKVRASSWAVQQQQTLEEQLSDALKLEEGNAWTSIINHQAQVQSMRTNLELAGENLEMSTYSYGEGQATILDVMQAQLSWISLYTNMIHAHFEYAIAVANYERITAKE